MSKKLTDIPYWLGTIRQFDYRLPTPVADTNSDSNLKNASVNANAAPYWIEIMRNGAFPTLETPIEEVKSQLRSAQVAAEKRLNHKKVMRSKILSAARKMRIKPGAQMRSASTRNEKPAWLATRDYFLYGS